MLRTVWTMVVLSALVSGLAAAEKSALMGRWLSSDGSVEMKVVSKERILFNGRPYACKIEGETIFVREGGVITPYFYKIEGKTLVLSDSQGGVLVFAKAEEASGSESSAQSGQNARPRGGSGENALLRGRFCSYSSSGMYGSGSYSSTNWAAFDGRGHFRYGSGGYYSGGGDLYGSEGADGEGTYEVRGNTIVLRYPDGSSDRAYVYNRGAGGRITEVRYGDSLYAPQLCE